MECEEFVTWCHIKCVGMSDNLYQVHMQHNSYVWICFKCGMPNFTNSTLFVAFDVSNHFDILDDSSNNIYNVTTDGCGIIRDHDCIGHW